MFCSAILLAANNARGALADKVAEYSFPASSLVMLHPTQPYMYATIPFQNSIAIINTNTLAVERTIFVGSGPSNLAFSPDGSHAYIANSASSFVVVFDTQTRSITKSFLIPERPHDVVFGSQNRLFVLGQEHIFQIDATTGASTRPRIYTYSADAPVSMYGGFLEVSPDRNTLYYADSGISPSTMYKINILGSSPILVLQTPFGTAGGNGEDLALSHSGSYIALPTARDRVGTRSRSSEPRTLPRLALSTLTRIPARSPLAQMIRLCLQSIQLAKSMSLTHTPFYRWEPFSLQPRQVSCRGFDRQVSFCGIYRPL